MPWLGSSGDCTWINRYIYKIDLFDWSQDSASKRDCNSNIFVGQGTMVLRNWKCTFQSAQQIWSKQITFREWSHQSNVHQKVCLPSKRAQQGLKCIPWAAMQPEIILFKKSSLLHQYFVIFPCKKYISILKQEVSD